MLYLDLPECQLHRCDNLHLLEQIPDESLELIYCDVLYNTKSKFTDYVDDLGTPQQAIDWYLPRLRHMHRILKPTGNLYLHCDWHLSDYLKVGLDGVFGFERFRNRIARIQCTAKNSGTNWGRLYDEILYYTKSARFTWNPPQTAKLDSKLETQYNKVDPSGRRYTTVSLNAKGERRGETGRPWLSRSHGSIGLPTGRHWCTVHAELDALEERGAIEWSSNSVPRRIYWADENLDQPCQNIIDIKSIGREAQYHSEVYDTQKPLELLDLIVAASSNPGDLVADFFLGSGTTAIAALAAGRRFVGCDISERSMTITETRLTAHGLIDQPQKQAAE